jgi:hypothetical protein
MTDALDREERDAAIARARSDLRAAAAWLAEGDRRHTAADGGSQR